MAGFLMNVGKAGEVAERSPAVISANMKEDMLLQKRMCVLDRSERSLVHQIKVDQKVLYKRFQSRLVRSKLGYARITGQKDVERQLRNKTIGALNTDIVACAEEDYGFLSKLEQRPCTANSYKANICQPKRPSPPKLRKPATRKQKLHPVLTERPSSADGGEGRGVSKRASILRPATTTGSRVVQEYMNHKHLTHPKTDSESSQDKECDKIDEIEESEVSRRKESQSTVCSEPKDVQCNGFDEIDGVKNENAEFDVENIEHSDKDNKKEDCCEQNEHNETNDPDKGDHEVSGAQRVKFLDNLTRPRTVAGGNSTDSLDNTPPSPTTPSPRRASKPAGFFVEEKKIDILELRLREARAKDYDEDVKKFCENLGEMKCPRVSPHADYYTVRLQSSQRPEADDEEITNAPGTPDEENRRCVGNIFIRSLTITELNWKY